MRNRYLVCALVSGGLALAPTMLTAQDYSTPPASNHTEFNHPGRYAHQNGTAGTASEMSDLRASSIIGQTVRTEAGERLGKVQDLIINLSSQSAPFAIIEYGGALGVGATHVAVPVTELKWSSDQRQLVMATTKDQFEASSTTPTGGWESVSNEDCLKNVNRYYGQPGTISQGRFERQELTGTTEGRESVRNPLEERGANGLVGTTNTISTDDYVVKQVNAVIRQNMGENASDIHVTVKKGVVILKGKTATVEQKQALENQIKAVPGVTSVEDRLRTAASE
jgi:sporulation protein YlmC with PRC-barrel domain